MLNCFIKKYKKIEIKTEEFFMDVNDLSIVVIIAIIIGSIISLILYYLPTIIAFGKGKTNKWAVFALNFFLGWSLIAWVIALVWALKQDIVDTRYRY